MKPLHLSAPVRQGLGSCLRPGGFALTERMLALVRLPTDPVVLDAGCGPGATLRLLSESGVGRTIGIDADASLLAEAGPGQRWVAQADLAHLPLADGCVDLIVCECAWNLTDRRRVMDEFARVTRAGAFLCLSDIYHRRQAPGGTGWPLPSCLSSASDLPTVRALVSRSGFMIERAEDHSRLLTQSAAEFVFAHGSLHGFWTAVTGDPDLAAQACAATAAHHPGLFLIIARRHGGP